MALNWEAKRLSHAIEAGDLDLPAPTKVAQDGRNYYKCLGVGMNSCNRLVKANAMVDITTLPDVTGDYVCDACVHILTVGHREKPAKYTKVGLLRQLGAPTDFMDDLEAKLAAIAAEVTARRKG